MKCLVCKKETPGLFCKTCINKIPIAIRMKYLAKRIRKYGKKKKNET